MDFLLILPSSSSKIYFRKRLPRSLILYSWNKFSDKIPPVVHTSKLKFDILPIHIFRKFTLKTSQENSKETNPHFYKVKMISITVHNTGLVDHQMSGLCWYKEVLYVSQLEPSLVRPVRIATLLRCTLQYCILGLSGKYFSSFTSAGNGNIMPCTKLLISLKYLVDLNIRLSRYEKIIELQNSDCLMCLM